MSEAQDALSVWLGDTLVGTLVRGNDGSSFVLDERYLYMADRPVLGQVFEDAPHGRYSARIGTPSWFSNLLPEGALRELIAERAGVHVTRNFFLLELMGEDLPGAVIVRREGEAPSDPPAEPDNVARDDQPLKFSLAGVQLKFSGHREGRGITIPARGQGGDWIVKLPDQRRDGVPENEFSMMRWARATGIDVPETMLVNVSAIENLPSEVRSVDGVAYAVERFDRTGSGRVHIEDMAQVINLTPGEKYRHTNYETITRIVGALAPEDTDEVIRRLVFLILSGNGDAHAKNWSLIYRDRRTARLAPAYDLISTVPYIPNDTFGLNLGRTKDFQKLDADRFGRFARRTGLEADHVNAVVVEQVRRSVDAWADLRDELPAVDAVKAEIDRRLEKLPLIKVL